MSTRVYVVINIIGGVLDGTYVFSKNGEQNAKDCYRGLICSNSPFTRKEIMDMWAADIRFDDIWQKDSGEYLYEKESDLYYPISTDDHDVYVTIENVDGK